MRIIAVFALLAFVGGYTISKPVHPNEDLIKLYGSARIVNGSTTQISEFPWQASLRTIFDNHICGAAIISERYAVTAQHCVTNGAWYYKVMVGNSVRTANDQENTHQVSVIHKHPGYDNGTGNFANDIAILEFSDSIDLTTDEYANSVALAEGSYDYANEQCQITGWGRLSGNGALADDLQKADTVVISNDECSDTWGVIPSSQVCVYTGSNGACNGDSGGPLTCNNTLVGVTSWGANGCGTSYPSVYTRISYYRDWIYDITGV